MSLNDFPGSSQIVVNNVLGDRKGKDVLAVLDEKIMGDTTEQ